MATKKTDIDAAPADELGHFKHHFSITMEMDKHPLMMAMASIALIIFLVYLWGKLRGNTGKAATPSIATTPAATQSTTTTPIVSPPITVPPQPPQPPPPPPPFPPPHPTVISGNARGNIGSPYDRGYGQKAGGVPGPGPVGSAGYGIVPYGAPLTALSTHPDAHGNITVSYNGQSGSMAIWDTTFQSS